MGLGTLCLLALIGFGLIRSQYATNSEINDRIKDRPQKLQSMEDASKKAEAISAQLADLSTNLCPESESDLATGDPAQWIYNTDPEFQGALQGGHFRQQPVVNWASGFAAGFPI